MIRELTLVAMGAGAALALVISCSDDAPDDADAAVCDCPTLMTVQDVRTNVGGGPGLVDATARCPSGYTLVGGGCEVASGGDPLRLVSAGERAPSSPPFVYICRWDNPMQVTTTITAWATCQSPP